MDCRVVAEAAVPVYDVSQPEDAIKIAIAKTGDVLNPDLNYVEINVGERQSPSGEELIPASLVAGEALVALELEMTAFNVEGDSEATIRYNRIDHNRVYQRGGGVYPLDSLIAR